MRRTWPWDHMSPSSSIWKPWLAGGLIWGLVDVQMVDLPVVLALEYYGEVLDVKNITEYYF